MPSDRADLDTLLDILTTKGSVIEQHGKRRLIVSYRGHRLERPTVLTVSPDTFTAYLEATSTDAAGAYPEVDPVTAAYRLLLVHLDEEFLGLDGPPTAIRVEGDRLVIERP